ncbi:MAG: DUF4012 domain-containing protein [Candidatus Levyibacteriota bacterium]
MANYLEVEEEKNQSSLLFVDLNSGLENILLDLLYEKLKDKTDCYALTRKKIPEGLSRLSALSIHLLDQLTQNPSYAVIFLDEEKQKKKTYEVIEKLSNGKTHIVVLVPYRIFEGFSDLILSCKDKPNVSFALVGDLFGIHMLHAPLSKIIQRALLKKEIYLSGNDLTPIFPISEEDVISGIQHILFALKGRVFVTTLFYDHPQTIVSLSHMIKRLEPELSIYFDEKKAVFLEGETVDQKNKFLKQKIGVVAQAPSVSFAGFEASCVPLQNPKLPVYTPSKRRLKRTGKLISFAVIQRLVAYMSVGFTLFIIASCIVFVLSILQFRDGVKSLTAGNITAARQSLQTSSSLYSSVSGVVEFSVYLSEFFGQNDVTRGVKMYATFMNEQKDMLPVIEKALQENPNMSKEELQQVLSSYMNVFFMTEEFNNEGNSRLRAFEHLEVPSRFFSALSVAPQILGYDGKKSYIILLQNNNELRPTGGFIGSVAYVEVENGKLSTVNIQDVYDLDGQLRGHIEPPFIVRRFLQPHLYLRDSNFSLNFQDAASSSALLYNLETGKNIDGVLAIDTQVLKTLVDIEGPITVPGLKNELTSNNIVDVVQNSIQADFFPGSTEKKRILSTIFNQLLFDIQSDNQKKVAFMKSLPRLLSEKHILLSFAKPSLEKAVIASSFAGSLEDLRVEKNTYPDYLSINEANIGVNKVNQFVDRKVEYAGLLKGNSLDSDVLVTLHNVGSENYKTYMRAVVPEGAKLLKIFFDGQEQKITPFITDPAVYERKGFKAPVGLEVSQEVKNGHKEIGFVTTVAKTSSLSVRILYETDYNFLDKDVLFYSFNFLKQPGTGAYPISVTLQTDGNYILEKEDNSPVLFEGAIDTDKEVKVKIVRSK